MTELAIFESDLRPMEYWHLRAVEKLDEWATGEPEGYSTGFIDLDKYSRLISGELTVIAARPSQGKTALGMQLAEHVARNLQEQDTPGCVAIFSAEMSGWSLFMRMAAAVCGVNTHKLRSGKGSEFELRQLRQSMDQIRSLPIWIDDNTGPTTAQMLEQLSRVNETLPVRMMLFDFMELGGDRATKEDLRISQIAHNLKGIAKTLEIPVVALSQLNRDVENRSNKMPNLSDLRYSGAIESLADVVMFIMRPEYYIERAQSVDVIDAGDSKGVAYIQYGKNRNGPVGLVKLAYISQYTKFANLQRETKP